MTECNLCNPERSDAELLEVHLRTVYAATRIVVMELLGTYYFDLNAWMSGDNILPSKAVGNVFDFSPNQFFGFLLSPTTNRRREQVPRHDPSSAQLYRNFLCNQTCGRIDEEIQEQHSLSHLIPLCLKIGTPTPNAPHSLLRCGSHLFLFLRLDRRRFLGRIDGVEALAFGGFKQLLRCRDEDNLRGLEHVASDDGCA